MKMLITVLILISSLTGHATIEYEGDPSYPSSAEITRNRACFEELSRENCEDPADDVRQFRSCLHNVFPRLTLGCQKLMSDLYSRKD
jgi:hypothetical protein